MPYARSGHGFYLYARACVALPAVTLALVGAHPITLTTAGVQVQSVE